MEHQTSIVHAATAIACIAHRGQSRRWGDGEYIGHVERVAGAVRESGGGDLRIAVAWLHDTVEDTKAELLDIHRAGFPLQVYAAVDAITKRPNENYRSYLARVRGDELARDVKVHDIRDNLSGLRSAVQMDLVCESEVADRVERYEMALDILEPTP